jgi:hypothetical protein
MEDEVVDVEDPMFAGDLKHRSFSHRRRSRRMRLLKCATQR